MFVERLKEQHGFRTLRKWSVMILFSTSLLLFAGLWFYFLGWGIQQLQNILFARP